MCEWVLGPLQKSHVTRKVLRDSLCCSGWQLAKWIAILRAVRQERAQRTKEFNNYAVTIKQKWKKRRKGIGRSNVFIYMSLFSLLLPSRPPQMGRWSQNSHCSRPEMRLKINFGQGGGFIKFFFWLISLSGPWAEHLGISGVCAKPAPSAQHP